MLDRAKFLQEIQSFTGGVFRDISSNKKIIAQAWAEVVAQEKELAAEIARRFMHCSLPYWQESPNTVYQIVLPDSDYAVLGIDGSQIYPDRHRAGLNCFMINIGSVFLSYGHEHSFVELASKPRLFTTAKEHNFREEEAFMTKDIVDLLREELEFAEGFLLAKEFLKKTDASRMLVCFDGSFIFWHLEGKPQEIKERFLSIYFNLLEQFCSNEILVASYISMPRNRELTNILAMSQCPSFRRMGRLCSSLSQCNCLLFGEVIDSDIVELFLQPGQRTTVFKSMSYVTREYPTSLVPCFFFIHVGQEIVRVEVPAWMTSIEGVIDKIAAILLDQAYKGNGYPVVLAEAHEQAVVKGYDQEFFYEILAQQAYAQGILFSQSQKSLKKKIMSI